MSSLSWHRKGLAVFNLHLQDSFAYRAQGLVWILTDTVPTITLPLMWLSAFGNRDQIMGFARHELVAYYLCLSVINNFVTSHPWDTMRDIKDGRLSIYLTRPFSYYWFIFNGNISWRIVRTFLYLPFFCVILLIFRRYLVWEGYYLGGWFFASIVLAHVLSYQLSWLLGLLAFYLVEVSGVYEFNYMLQGFLAGQMAPLSLLPPTVQTIAHILPFSYVLWFPVNIFLGRVEGAPLFQGLAVQLCWITVLGIAGQLLWRDGLKKYTGVGI